MSFFRLRIREFLDNRGRWQGQVTDSTGIKWNRSISTNEEDAMEIGIIKILKQRKLN